jgi:8-oxo-dGTP diphosphatase
MSDTPYAPTPHLIAVDIVVKRGQDYLFIQRKNAPFKGRLALPGGFIEPGQTAEVAAAAELKEETGIKVDPRAARLIGVWSDPERDPRGRTISLAFLFEVPLKTQAKAGDDAAEVRWLTEAKIMGRKLAFDHLDILMGAWTLEKEDAAFHNAPHQAIEFAAGYLKLDPGPADKLRAAAAKTFGTKIYKRSLRAKESV